MWVYAEYEPVAVFGLRPSNTTSSGGKSLVCPTPYGIKMALLDRAIREAGLDNALVDFEAIRDMAVWVSLPDAVTVNRTFQKIFRSQKSTLNAVTGRIEVWTSTIVQREYCLFTGVLTLALQTDDDFAARLPDLLSGINYFGRRGSFMQLVNWAITKDAPDAGLYTQISRVESKPPLSFGYLQRMDDMRVDAEWEDVDAFHGRRRGDGGRTQYNVIIPYQLAHNGPGHTIYTVQGVRLA
ncbi:MAG: hypothetical protein GYB68_16675 [Chloroflexi bacterium]|nr:hypothetical protein [Chloroflexota bacterium]